MTENQASTFDACGRLTNHLGSTKVNASPCQSHLEIHHFDESHDLLAPPATCLSRKPLRQVSRMPANLFLPSPRFLEPAVIPPQGSHQQILAQSPCQDHSSFFVEEFVPRGGREDSPGRLPELLHATCVRSVNLVNNPQTLIIEVSSGPLLPFVRIAFARYINRALDNTKPRLRPRCSNALLLQRIARARR